MKCDLVGEFYKEHFIYYIIFIRRFIENYISIMNA